MGYSVDRLVESMEFSTMPLENNPLWGVFWNKLPDDGRMVIESGGGKEMVFNSRIDAMKYLTNFVRDNGLYLHRGELYETYGEGVVNRYYAWITVVNKNGGLYDDFCIDRYLDD